MPPRLALDVSNVNPITETLLRQSGASLLIAKGTEGSSFYDKTLSVHRHIAKNVGVAFGTYLFLHAASPGSEAATYLREVRPKPGELVIIDSEAGGQDGLSVAELARRTDRCARALEAKGFHPWLYSSSSLVLEMVAAVPALRRLPIWQAQYPYRGLARWSPKLARLRIRLRHGLTVKLWQFTDAYQVGRRRYDASRILAPLGEL